MPNFALRFGSLGFCFNLDKLDNLDVNFSLKMRLSILLAVGVLCVGLCLGQDTVTVQTPSGDITGLRGTKVNKFRGIPFAQPPVGNLRWAAPVKVRPLLPPLLLLHFFRPSLSKRNKKTHHVTFPSSFLHPQRVAETNVFFLLLSTACTSVCECNVLSCWMHAKVRSAATHVSSYDL